MGWFSSPFIEERLYLKKMTNTKKITDGSRPLLSRSGCIYKELLDSYFNSDENYGIAFYACGYDGRAQQEFAQSWADSGVRVF